MRDCDTGHKALCPVSVPTVGGDVKVCGIGKERRFLPLVTHPQVRPFYAVVGDGLVSAVRADPGRPSPGRRACAPPTGGRGRRA